MKTLCTLLAVVLLAASSHAASLKISQFANKATLSSNDLFVTANTGTNNSVRWYQLKVQASNEAMVPLVTSATNGALTVVTQLVNTATNPFMLRTNGQGWGNLTVQSNVIATNFMLTGCGQYIDLMPLAYSGGPAATAPQRIQVVGHNIFVLGWDNNDATDYVFQLPHNPSQTNASCPETILVPHVHLTPTNNIGGSSTNVKFTASWVYAPRSGAPSLMGTNTTQIAITGVNTNKAGNGYYPLFAITNNNLGYSDFIFLHLERVAADSNEIAGRIGVGVDFHVPVGNQYSHGTP